jgi:hypothetical protein
VPIKIFLLPMSFVIALFSYTTSITAGELRYECIIKNIYDLDDTGGVKESGFSKYLVGGNFMVSRETGEVTGDSLTTITAESTKVISSGSSQNSFKSIAEFNGQAQLIEIKEYSKDEQKPFISLSMGGAGLVTGLCR